MKNKELFHNKWISLFEIFDNDTNTSGYIYSHETRCNGEIVAILPYRKFYISSGGNISTGMEIEFLLRLERTPSWSMRRLLSSITGGVETKDLRVDVLRELEEEAGYTISKSKLISLGTCRGTKSCDTIYHLFSADLTGVEQHEYYGDGTEYADSESVWVNANKFLKCVDPIAYTMYVKLLHKL